MEGIPGFFTEDEGRWYARFARGLVGGIFVEVGSWKGRSTSFIGPTCRANGTRLVCVDHWQGSHDGLAATYARALAEEDVEATFRANMKALAIDVEVLAEPSLTAATRFADGTVGRVFLDGGHDEETVTQDLVAWFPRLCADGLLGGHDYDEKHEGLVKAVDRFARAHGLVVERGPRSVYALVTAPR